MIAPDHQFFPFISDDLALKQVVDAIRNEMDEYIRKYKLNSLVLGISGGIDSALCAALLNPVCQQNHIPLIGRSITIETNSSEEIDRSVKIGENFCTDFQLMDLTPTYYENCKNLILLDDTMLSKMRKGNMKARMRMIVLFDLAQLYKGLVISTDNYTEYLTGFWTLHGDVGDYAIIMNLWKTEVYHLSKYLLKEYNSLQQEALQLCIDATPVDGLGISKSDCEQLQVQNYYEADRLFYEYFVEKDVALETHPLIKRYKSSDYKRNNPLVTARSKFI
ncbi:MAG: NAD(+) synthase [Bacteroidales bacterium]|jgi:NAD+ synthetase|nr:NAD(+) synthase [Bacteroidales bacterium]